MRGDAADSTSGHFTFVMALLMEATVLVIAATDLIAAFNYKVQGALQRCLLASSCASKASRRLHFLNKKTHLPYNTDQLATLEITL